MSANDCPHGIPHEQRKRDGCEDCDLASYNEFRAKQEAAKFRARVIQTARAVLPQMAGAWLVAGHADSEGPTHDAFRYAEAFERHADAFLKDGGIRMTAPSPNSWDEDAIDDCEGCASPEVADTGGGCLYIVMAVAALAFFGLIAWAIVDAVR